MNLQSTEALLEGERFKLYGYEGEGWFDAFEKNFGRLYAEFNFDRVRPLLQEDSVCLDIGANLGVWSLILSGFVPRGKVHAFEGSPLLNAALSKTIAASGRHNIELHPWVVGKENSSGTFYEDTNWLSSSRFIPSLGGLCHTQTIDSLELPRVDFMKIDVEGSELDVLDGASETIARCDPIIILEFNSFALVHYRELIPRQVLNNLCNRFQTVGFYTDKFVLAPRKMTDREEFLCWNMHSGFVHDLVCVNRQMMEVRTEKAA